MAKVYNLLDDLMKIAGGAPEAFWMNARAGLQADIDMEMELDDEDATALADEIEEYQHQLRRIIKTRGVDLKPLGTEVASPKDQFNMLISLLSGTTGIPQRILIGSEAGQLASEQDRANWAERIEERRVLFAEPYILDPLIRRFMEVGLLPEIDDYEYEWPEAFKVSPLESAQTMASQARAIGNMARQTGGKNPMQITTQKEAREIIGLEGKIPDGELEQSDRDFQAEQDELDREEQAKIREAAPDPAAVVPGKPNGAVVPKEAA